MCNYGSAAGASTVLNGKLCWHAAPCRHSFLPRSLSFPCKSCLSRILFLEYSWRSLAGWLAGGRSSFISRPKCVLPCRDFSCLVHLRTFTHAQWHRTAWSRLVFLQSLKTFTISSWAKWFADCFEAPLALWLPNKLIHFFASCTIVSLSNVASFLPIEWRDLRSKLFMDRTTLLLGLNKSGWRAQQI